MASIENQGRLINFLSGITGVTAGGQAVVNLPVNQRYHRIALQCSAVNYTGGTGLATVALTGAGNDDLTVTPTVSMGRITAVAVVAGGTGYVTGDTITITDDTGAGFVGTVTAAAGVVSAVAITADGTPTPMSPRTFFSDVKLLVNGVNMRDITPDSIMRIVQASGYQPELGELPIFFTPPWRNVVAQNDLTSWDLFGQSTFQIQFTISRGLVSPALTGVTEFDYKRNTRTGPKGESILVLQPTAQHEFSYPIAAGRNDITTLPASFPISRLWLLGSSPGNITQVEVLADGNKVFEAGLEQLRQMYSQYGFQFGKTNWLNTTYAGSSALIGEFEPPVYFEGAFIADPDQRWWKALRVANDLTLRVYSNAAQTLRIAMETLPGAYA